MPNRLYIRLDETEGRLETAPLTGGWGVSVELIGLVISLTLLPLSIVAGVVTLVISGGFVLLKGGL